MGRLSQVVADTDPSGTITTLYIRAGDELLEVMRPGMTPGTWSTKFIHHDGLGSVRALTDETGTTVDTRAYEAFGTKNTEAGNDPLTYGFAGEPLQADSMLAYHRARWMDARVGRFFGMDTMDGDSRIPGTLHRYVYGSNCPTRVVDPTGYEGADSEPNYSFSAGYAVLPSRFKLISWPYVLWIAGGSALATATTNALLLEWNNNLDWPSNDALAWHVLIPALESAGASLILGAGRAAPEVSIAIGGAVALATEAYYDKRPFEIGLNLIPTVFTTATGLVANRYGVSGPVTAAWLELAGLTATAVELSILLGQTKPDENFLPANPPPGP